MSAPFGTPGIALRLTSVDSIVERNETGPPPEIVFEMPSSTDSMPSVTRNDGTRSATVTAPLTKPTNPLTRIVRTIASGPPRSSIQ